MLSNLTQEAGVVMVPQLSQGSFRHLKLIPMDAGEIVGVLIATEGLIRHATMEVEEQVSEAELEQLEHFINQELGGMPLSQIHAYLQQSLFQEKSPFAHLFKRASELLDLESFFDDPTSLLLEGTSWILEAPEFRDMERTKRLLRALEKKGELDEILRKDLGSSEVKLHIGAENRGTSLTDCTVVAAPYRFKGGVMGAIGVVGPTRLDYPRVTSLVGRMAQAVTRAFQEIGG